MSSRCATRTCSPTSWARSSSAPRRRRTPRWCPLAAFPETGFVNGYGLTETSSTIALLGPEDHRTALAASNPVQRARLGSAGRPVPGIELQIRDDDGVGLGVNQVGELWVRGPQVSGEYVGIGSVLEA
jgi:acyl-CoA synthetase (AMP-forming)/AMP-acid ligase II